MLQFNRDCSQRSQIRQTLCCTQIRNMYPREVSSIKTKLGLVEPHAFTRQVCACAVYVTIFGLLRTALNSIRENVTPDSIDGTKKMPENLPKFSVEARPNFLCSHTKWHWFLCRFCTVTLEKFGPTSTEMLDADIKRRTASSLFWA